MIRNKKQMYVVIGAFIVVLVLFTTTYAFFNYTRTGTANNIRTGRISFNTTQNGTLNLTNVFPVASNSVGNDYSQDTVTINITGDTTYANGIEYLVTAEDVHTETSTGKKVPLTLKVAVTNNLGTQDTDNDQIEYFTDRGGNTSYYKNLSESVLYDGQYLLVGYIASGQTGINGTINIKAYLDDTKIGISDTYPEGEVSHVEGVEPNQGTVIDGYNGTPNSFGTGRVVLTTNEWNSLQQQGNELSFKIRVEANEGTWVDPAVPINAAGSIPEALKENITEIYFIKETPIRLQQRYDAATVKADMTDTTLNEGKVLAWQEGNKLYIASTGETYLPQNCPLYFGELSNVEKIEFENINTSRVTNMVVMFQNYGGTSLDISSFDTSNVTNMNGLFQGSSRLEYINMTGIGNNNISQLNGIFGNCPNLKTIDMTRVNFGTFSSYLFDISHTNVETIILSDANMSSITNWTGYFASVSNLKTIDLSGVDISNVTNMAGLFSGDAALKTIYVSNSWNVDNLNSSNDMFDGCTSLVGGAGTHFDANNPIDKTYAHIDGGQSNPGYLTLKNN